MAQPTPLVRLGDAWPTGAPHPTTGWTPPIHRVHLSSGLEIRIHEWGDAVPGGYNGGFVAVDARSEDPLGRIEYQSADTGGGVLIAWIEVEPALRGRGLADILLARLIHEFPGQTIEPGLMTESGVRWWGRVQKVTASTNRSEE